MQIYAAAGSCPFDSGDNDCGAVVDVFKITADAAVLAKHKNLTKAVWAKGQHQDDGSCPTR
jgi:hypothetical protein